jgi:transglutaminase-like putative cysteine protease
MVLKKTASNKMASNAAVKFLTGWQRLTPSTLALLLFGAVSHTAVHGASLPRWVKTAAATHFQGSLDKSTPYIVLLDEAVTTVGKSGKAETRYRFVAEILTPEGRSAARREVYSDEETTISVARGWHLGPGGKVVTLARTEIREESPPDDLYSDVKTKVMRFGDADRGSIVAFEWVQKERPFINQEYHFFQGRAPVVMSRYSLRLPSDWRLEPVVFNHEPITPTVDKSRYSWELLNLGPIAEEPRMPTPMSISPYLAVSYFPSHGKVAKKSFSSWQDVSRWASQMLDRQAVPNAAVQQKARSLVDGATSDQDKIRIISGWVQKQIRYVSIQLGTKEGYRPHLAAIVFKKGYGDCKDKAALMIAMLRSVGIESYTVLVYSDDATWVKPEFPSILQFNHAIVAVSDAGDRAQPYGKSGGLIFFDPTDNLTPLGDLPYYLQGGLGLVVRGEAGELVRLPVLSESANATRREADLDLEAGGAVTATVRELLTGQAAAAFRRGLASSSSSDLVTNVSAQISRALPGAQILGVRVPESPEDPNPISLEYSMRSTSLANRSGNLLVIKPLAIWGSQFPSFSSTERRQPVIFEMKSTQNDVVRIKIPAGCYVDEPPQDIRLTTSFGTFVQTCLSSEDHVTIQRQLVLSSRLVPAAEYRDLKKFFDLAKSESVVSIVLVNK